VTVAVATVALTAALVAEATGGRLAAGSPDAVFSGLSIDSRTTAAGALFVAIQGDRFDGHEFVTNALSQGASGLMVSQPIDAPPGVAVIAVPDTLQALQRSGAGHPPPVARHRRRDHGQRRQDFRRRN
jgi:UDP-N-acetylmuramoyl-tripeptide--D-alanyl-D-alanine ligase